MTRFTLAGKSEQLASMAAQLEAMEALRKKTDQLLVREPSVGPARRTRVRLQPAAPSGPMRAPGG